MASHAKLKKRTAHPAPSNKQQATRKSSSSVSSNSKHRPATIIVVDDDRFMREVISAMLSRQRGAYNVIGQAADAAEAIRICAELAPDVVILDINLPDQSGIDIVPELKRIAPTTRILLCTAYVCDSRVVDALRCGAHGFVEKTNAWTDFATAVERVASGELYFAAKIGDTDGLPGSPNGHGPALSSPAALSEREKEVLTLIAQGRTSKETATELGISVATVDTHRANVMTKLGVHNIAGLVVYAFRNGIIKIGAGGLALFAAAPVA